MYSLIWGLKDLGPLFVLWLTKVDGFEIETFNIPTYVRV